MTATPDRLTRLARALAIATTRPPVATTSVALQLRNPLNGGGLSTSRGARMASNTRRKAERAKGVMLAFELASHWYSSETLESGHMCVVLTRISPKPFDDDNNAAALKSVRDGMAEAWGIDDADPRVTWVTDWRKGKAHAVEAALWVVPETPNLPWRSREEELAELGALAKHLPMPSDVEVDASDYERPGRPVGLATTGLMRNPLDVLNRKREMSESGSDLIGSRREVRVTPNVIRAKAGF